MLSRTDPDPLPTDHICEFQGSDSLYMRNPNREAINHPLTSPMFQGTLRVLQHPKWPPGTGHYNVGHHAYPTIAFDLGKEYIISRIIYLLKPDKALYSPNYFYASWEAPIVTGSRDPKDQPPMVLCSKFDRYYRPDYAATAMNCEDCVVAGRWIVAERKLGHMAMSSFGVYGMEIPSNLLEEWKKLYDKMH